ncbi:MAG: 50S ribosomal protein L11 methyltransferase [Myxococcota bacterium]|nr:50S ribosomal protein L11 methyltransferase [Myxococcota bacterium]
MSDCWHELRWIVPVKLTEILGAELSDMGAVGIQEEYLPGEEPEPLQPWEQDRIIEERPLRLLKVWFPVEIEKENLLSSLIERYPSTGTHSWSQINIDDWDSDWKRHFHRLIFSDALVISPPWEAKEGDLVLEPGLAFGTGDHPTTRSCLEAISLWAKEGGSCLDVGCGSGILSLAAAKLGMSAIGIDTDPDAIHSSLENARMNGLSIRFETTPVAELGGMYDIVVANLYAEVLVELAPFILPMVKEKIALAGILSDRAHLVRSAFEPLTLIREQKDGDWISLWYCA